MKRSQVVAKVPEAPFLRRPVVALLMAGVFTIGLGVGVLQASSAEVPATATGGALETAASDLAARIAIDGTGVRWEVLQDQIVSGPEGKASLAVSSISRGYANSTTFVQEIRHSNDPSTLGIFELAVSDFSTVVKDGVVWRNEGDGYFATSRALTPGLGIDPFTLTQLPDLLRNLRPVKDLGDETVDGRSLHHYQGEGDAADWPGIVASDGLAFTESPIEIDVWLDSNDRLVRLQGVTRNLAETDAVLLITTTVTFADGLPAVLAEPEPKLVGSPEPGP